MSSDCAGILVETPASASARLPIAIVGMSGRFAKSPDLEALWRNLEAGVDCVGEADGSRWDLGYHLQGSHSPARIYTRAGGFLDRIDAFDAEFFGMSPKEVKQVDPQHRLLLELTWEALERAGLPPSRLAGTKTGVFVGISQNDYATLVDDAPNAYTNIGSALSIAANRVSYVFDLHGPSFSVDTACSSSLVALHQACISLATGGCEAALVGGVNLLLSPTPFIGFAQASMLSPDGRCKSFDADGKGYVRAEGGGVVVLKPLAQAQADGDRILGVILGSGVNSDGRTMGMALPSGDAQEALLRQVYAECGVDPAQVFYVEAHGTGTAAGDPIECGAIGRVMGAGRASGDVCHLGSVKSNIGHLESGAGMAGLIKTLLAIQNGRIPANLHFNTPNPKIDFEGGRLAVVDKTLPLPERDAPLLFGVNSFGFGGTNAHVVLQAPPKPELRAQERATPAAVAASDLLVISARSPESLDALARAHAERLATLAEQDWPAWKATAATMRDRLPHAIALKAGSAAEAADKLTRLAVGESAPGAARQKAAGAGRLAFVFSGNGPQWQGMGRELFAANAAFRAEIEAVDATFAKLAGWSLIDTMRQPPESVNIGKTEIAQPLLFAQQLALVAALRAEGVVPKLAFGHSVGEAAAAAASGALTREQATQVIFHRSRAQALTAGKGRMAALSVTLEEAQSLIDEIGGWIEIAAINAPRAVTVAGDADRLQDLCDRVADEGKFARMLALDYAFHTSAMDPIEADLRANLAALHPSASAIPFVSTVEGKPIAGESLDADYWWRNIRRPVHFLDAARAAMRDHGADAMLEIGPHPVLRDYLVQIAKADSASLVAFASLRRPSADKPASDVESLETAVVATFAASAGDLAALYARPAKAASLPLYPWNRTRHWRGAWKLPDAEIATAREHVLLGARRAGADGVWTNSIQAIHAGYLLDHVVQGAPLFPAAGYIEMGLAAGALVYGQDAIDIEGFEILRPLVLADAAEPIVQTILEAADGTLAIHARPDTQAKDWTDHVHGRVSRIEADEPRPRLDLDALRAALPVTVEADAHYADCTRRGLAYGPNFQGVRAVRLTPADAAERIALAEIALPHLEGKLEGYAAHPGLLDSALQALITLIAQTEARDCATIPVRVGRVRKFAALPASVVCRVRLRHESARTGVADIDIADRDGHVLVQLIEARFQKVDFRPATLPLIAEDWRPDPAWAARNAAPAPSPAEVVVAARAASLAILESAEIARAAPRLDALIDAYATQQNPEAARRELLRDCPGLGAEAVAIARASEGKSEIAMREMLEDTAPLRQPVNRIVAELVRAAVAAAAPGHALRLIECDGASGGLAAAVLPVLPPERCDYLFCDPSEQAAARARNRFAAHHFVRVVARAADGIEETGFDLALSGAGTSPAQLLPRLAPGGLAIVATPPGGRLGAMLGIDPGPDPRAALEAAGFVDVVEAAAIAGAAILVARRPAEAVAPAQIVLPAPARYVLVAGARDAETAFVAECVRALQRKGQMASVAKLDPQALTDDALGQLVAGAGGPAHFVHLAGWAAADADLESQDLRCYSAAVLARVLAETEGNTLTLVTRGAFATPGGEGPRDPFQATAAGMARVIGNEFVTLGCRLIDVAAEPDATEPAQELADALTAPDAETETLLADGRRYLRRLRHTTLAEQTRIAGARPPREDRGFRLDFHAQGGLDSLHLREIERRAPGAGEVEIRIVAAGLNFRDVLYTMGVLPEEAVEKGFSGPTIGMECAGVIARVGAGVSGLAPGDRVIAFASSCFASHVTTDAGSVARAPDGMSLAAAATIPTAFVTAWYALDQLARLEEGETVLIHGAAGGVGLAALQIAKLKGARVIATAGAADKQKLVRTLGADHVVSSRSLKFADDVMRLTGGKGVDVVLNSLAGEAIAKGLQVLKPFGRFLEIGKRDLYANSRIGLRPFRENLSYFGIDADTLLVERPKLARKVFGEVTTHMASGALRPLPYQVTPISRAGEAFRAMQQARHVGKLVVGLDLEPQAQLPVVASGANAVRGDATYLVTGGLSGFGLATAEWLVAQGARSLALVGRRGEAAPGATEALARLRAAGATARAFAADVSDKAAVLGVLDEVRATMAQLKGVIHAAAVIDDAPIVKIELEQMRRVMAAKMKGAWLLHEATRGDGLEIFALYSSASATVGNPGQGLYVAANMFLNALAEHRRALGLPALAVCWGAINDAGFLTRHDGIEYMLESRLGMLATSSRVALADLARYLESGATTFLAAQFNLARLGQNLAGARTPRFSPLFPGGFDLVDGGASAAEALAAMDDEERRASLTARVIEHVARVVGASAAQIEPTQALTDLGLDSLMAVELAEMLEQTIGRPVPVMQMIQAGTVAGVVETIDRAFSRTPAAPGGKPDAKIAA